VKEVEVLKKLKLAIFGVQSKSDPSTFFNHGGAAPPITIHTSSLAAIHSIMPTEASGALAAIDSIMVSKSR